MLTGYGRNRGKFLGARLPTVRVSSSKSMRASLIVSAVAAIVFITGTAGHARVQQAQQQISGLILGRVVDATSNAPIRGAIVVIANFAERGGGPVGVMTDANGQFAFGGLPGGRFRLHATKFGYHAGAYGQRRPNADGTDAGQLVLKNDERIGDVTIRLWKHAVITGTVLDEFGEPAVSVDVRAFRKVFVAGRPKLGAGVAYDQTDDRGIYRFTRLVPGDYVVAIVRTESSSPSSLMEQIDQSGRSGDRDALMAGFAEVESAGVAFGRPGWPSAIRVGTSIYGLGTPPASVRNGRLFVYPPQFYGGTADIAAARTISVRAGQEVTGADFAMKPVPSVRVSGQVVDQNGPAAGIPVRLTSVGSGDFAFDRSASANVAITDASGKFTLLGVTPGEKVLRLLKGPPADEGAFGIVEASSTSDAGAVLSTSREFFSVPPPAPNAPTLFATTTIGVGDTDIDNLSLVVRNGVRISGRVEFAGTKPPPEAGALKHIRIEIEQKTGFQFGWAFDMTGHVTPDRKFETAEVPPGAYLLLPYPVDGWTLESVTVGGRDVSDVPLDILDKPVSSVVVRYTDKPSVLSGTVRTAGRDDSIDDATVVVFPSDKNRWIDYGSRPRRLQQIDPARDGTFTLTGLPPGEYFLAAIHDDLLTDWHDPAVLEKISAVATRVTLGAAEQKSQGLVMVRIR